MRIIFIFLIFLVSAKSQVTVNQLDSWATQKWFHLGPFDSDLSNNHNEIINTLSMASPFSLEEKQI